MTESHTIAQAESRLGTLIRGKYRLDKVLGIGGMAVVYKATHRNQAQFAVKMLHPEVSLNADIRSRFLREGYAANSIKHPGAVLVVDDDVGEDGAAFLVMELLDGIGCEEAWEHAGHKVSAEVASAILIQLLDVLAAAHAAEIVHRDIKPANLFLNRNGVVKVLDFGIARARAAMAAGVSATSTGMTLGTPAYMAPEQALGRTQEVDARSDLWAAGATFCSLVSGTYVHSAGTANEMLIRAATEQARPLATLAPFVPRPILAVMDRALAFRKEDRWESAGAMRSALMSACPVAAATPEALVATLIPGIAAGSSSQTVLEPPHAHVVTPSPAGSGSRAGSGARPRAAATTSVPIASESGARPGGGRGLGVSIAIGIAVLGLGAAIAIGGAKWARRGQAAQFEPDATPGLPSAIAQSALERTAQKAVETTRQGSSNDVTPPPACAQDAVQCVGSVPQKCSGGQWVNGFVTAGTCGAACTPGISSPRCGDTGVPQTCASTGEWQNGSLCSRSEKCQDGACVHGAGHAGGTAGGTTPKPPVVNTGATPKPPPTVGDQLPDNSRQ